ncbi:hypothetical protein [Bradyrhizobium sp. LTSP857]|uniref:hypothetical protein n=1 Tax=Bradyrhizobium sp. LTSP857 TaxID=1619231 RepID=UPI0005E74626|nr:hypothetical protein [Bradyrhizobium sp. LTSP857]KJC44522.1 hypothetical protein UP06_18825 [Bradyrhizobium sp. LTSP857]
MGGYCEGGNRSLTIGPGNRKLRRNPVKRLVDIHTDAWGQDERQAGLTEEALARKTFDDLEDVRHQELREICDLEDRIDVLEELAKEFGRRNEANQVTLLAQVKELEAKQFASPILK